MVGLLVFKLCLDKTGIRIRPDLDVRSLVQDSL